MLGNGRLEAMCFDGVKRLANIRGKLRKKTWINQGDIILLSRKKESPHPAFRNISARHRYGDADAHFFFSSLLVREFQDGKGDVIQKYSADEARSLKAYGELPESAKINGMSIVTLCRRRIVSRLPYDANPVSPKTETDTFGADNDGDCGFEFGDEDASDSDDDGAKEISIDDI